MTTAADYLQFAQMLLNGGQLNGKRFLSPKTVELMTSNHTGDLVNGQFGRPAAGMGFGLGVQIVEDPAMSGLRPSKGSWGLAGAYGTRHIEPLENGDDHHDEGARTPSGRERGVHGSPRYQAFRRGMIKMALAPRAPRRSRAAAPRPRRVAIGRHVTGRRLGASRGTGPARTTPEETPLRPISGRWCRAPRPPIFVIRTSAPLGLGPAVAASGRPARWRHPGHGGWRGGSGRS
jgi:hypothetical protein